MQKLLWKTSFVAVGIATLLSPLASSASQLTQAQVNAIIGLLQSFGADASVVANVQASLTGGSATVPPTQQWCHTFNTNLKINDRNDEVYALQTALDKSGFAVQLSDRAREPLFNDSFASAVTGFQEKYKDEILTPNGLKNGTGYVGPSTRKKLNQLYGCGVKPPVTQSSCENLKENECLVNYGCYAFYQRYEVPPGPDGQFSNISSFNSCRPQKSNLLNCKKVLNSFGTNACIADSISPSITVLSPNGGETWKIGQTYSIVWEANKVLGVGIQVVADETSDEPYLLSKDYLQADIAKSGQYTFTLKNWWQGDALVPVVAGKYKIRLVTGVGGPTDSSDVPFSIVAQ